MQWIQLLNPKRFREKVTVKEAETDRRSQFKRDFDAVCNSTIIRRLQDKAQVFPLEEGDFSRTRLTHSIEVMSVAETLGEYAVEVIKEKSKTKEGQKFLFGDHSTEKVTDIIGDIPCIMKTIALLHDMGNPPFVGARWMNKAQKDDVISVYFISWKGVSDLDYVSCWYKKAVDYIKTTSIDTAFVSTNSISQGASVSNLWGPLFDEGIHINFAHRTFIWDSEASVKAQVHCVIIGFSFFKTDKAFLFSENGAKTLASNINGYLLDAPNIFIQNRGGCINNGLPKMSKGSQPTDGGNLLLSEKEKDELIKTDPLAAQWIYQFMMGNDYINNIKRYCLWMVNAKPAEIKKCPHVVERINNVKNLRLKSPTKSVQRDADTPTLFTQRRQPNTTYLVIPRVSSQNRRYIPIGFLNPDVIAGDKLQFIVTDSKIIFGVLISNVHMAWMRVVAGRLKSDYSYSPAVYNNFPWPTPSDAQRATIETTAQGILDARALYPDSSLADLYDPLTMPPELRKAHQKNDAAVMSAYGMPIKTTDEAACVAWLMRLYQEKTKK